jgi:hypothetical protein
LAEQFKEEMELGSFTTATQFAQRIDQRIENKFKQLNQTDKQVYTCPEALTVYIIQLIFLKARSMSSMHEFIPEFFK